LRVLLALFVIVTELRPYHDFLPTLFALYRRLLMKTTLLIEEPAVS
jgi:hypothetical protein